MVTLPRRMSGVKRQTGRFGDESLRNVQGRARRANWTKVRAFPTELAVVLVDG